LAANVIMPALGVAQQTGTLLKWLKAEGESVSKGEPLMEIETDKATVEIEAPASGTLTNVSACAGDEIPVGNRIAVILAPGEVATPAAVQDPHPRPLPKGEGISQTRPLPKRKETGEGPPATSTPTLPSEPAASTASDGERLLASPAAKRIAREKGVDLASLKGSGPEGTILAADVLRAASEPTATSMPDRLIPLSRMRRIVSERMTLSKQTAPHFYLSMEIDMSAVVDCRTEQKKRPNQGVPSTNDYILYACAQALKVFPAINASFSDQGINLHDDIHLGMAVALDEGLVVPVIRYADRLTLNELAAQSRELIDRAQSKKLFPLDYEGGTFTVSNLGLLGVDSFTAIINPPQCAILAVGRVAERVVADHGMFAIKPLMTVTLSADHRVIDGAVGARFLREVRQVLETGEF
jgi:pyruvate dehydrogenase E2 component (dihydrolipoamide acetyltransferase)